MNKSIIILVIALILEQAFISEARAAGLYEIGKAILNNMECRWTSFTRQNCMKNMMEKKIKELNKCTDRYMGQSKKELDACVKQKNPQQCFDEKMSKFFSKCCLETSGELKKLSEDENF